MSERISEEMARRIVTEAVERLGGGRMIEASPRHAYSLRPTETVDVGEHQVLVTYGEMSSPAIADVEGWIFQIREAGLELLDRPRGEYR